MGGLRLEHYLRRLKAGQKSLSGRPWLYRFDRPSFLGGLAHIFDFGGTLCDYYYPSGDGYEEDIAAIRSDWIAIGHDMQDAIDEFRSSMPDS